jgi:hypothetical protein
LHFDTISVSPQAYVREINDQLYLNFMKVGLQLRKHCHVFTLKSATFKAKTTSFSF